MPVRGPDGRHRRAWSPDNQALCDEAEAFDQLLEDITALPVADAPAQGFELLTFGDCQVKKPTAGEGVARVLSLDGRWLEGQVCHRGGRLAFTPGKLIASGMSGSPIVNTQGEAIGVVSTEALNPVITYALSAGLVCAIENDF